MAFFENLGKAAQAAAKKSGEIVEVTKLNMNIKSEEDSIEKLYNQIGKGLFDQFSQGNDVPADFKEICNTISTHLEAIKGLRRKILEVKNLKTCTNCGNELEMNVVFCNKCGTKQEIPADTQATEAPQPVNQRTCPSCGAQVPQGNAFCTGCGAKME